MLKLALASVVTGVMAFAAVAFWPSHGPSREVTLSVIQPASTDVGTDVIRDVLTEGSKKETSRLEQQGEIELARLEETPPAFEPPGSEEAYGSLPSDSSAEDASNEPDGPDESTGEENATASFGEDDQALTSTDGVGSPRLPVRKPARANEPTLPNYSLLERVAEIGPGAIARLEVKFSDAGVAWPPQRLAFLAFKDEKVIEVQAQSADGSWSPVYRYPVEAASGGAGPKLKEGDKQVPEGLYKIVSLNPNSRYHVSLRVGYPNDFDRAMAKADGRKKLGGDIMIHGRNLSAGCLAVGDDGAEEFFVMAHAVGLHNLDVVIAPRDFRKPSVFAAVTETVNLSGPAWLPKLYDDIKVALEPFPEMPPAAATPNVAQK